MRFTKMSGSGNDFIVVDNRAGAVPDAEAGRTARLLSRHRLSVGADGIVLLSTPAGMPGDVSYVWRYVNADGTDGEMCGNGAMCAARFAVSTRIAPACHSFLTPSGRVDARVDATTGMVSLRMVDPGPIEAPVAITAHGRTLECWRIAVGVPHVVALVDDADAFAEAALFDEIGRDIRYHRAFAPAGTNLNIVSRIEPGRWRMRTWERGVEAETLACGTGAVASAIVLGDVAGEQSPTRIRTSGGRDLVVTYRRTGDKCSDVELAGHAAEIYTADLGPDAQLT